jgi:exodeoxyribonuclease-3
MKIITWNCNMAFRKKADIILAYKPDILVVPECECPEKLIFNAHTQKPTDILWFGANRNKGLAIFSYGGFRLKTLDVHNEDLQTIVPVSVTGGLFDFTLFAVWANNPNDPDGQYVEQVWKAIHHYDHLLLPKRTVLAGDFNSNTIWDRKRRAGNHSNVVKRLAEKGIHSAYHVHHGQMQGKEQHPTFYLYKNQYKPYHLDYCFVSEDIAMQISAVEIGDYGSWRQYSDHVPVIITIAD